MPGEVIDCVAERKKQYEMFRKDIAGTQFAEVEVDTETGEVRVLKMVSVNDCGFPMNTLTTQSQVIGAMIQGVSWALLEDRIIDPNVGTMVNAGPRGVQDPVPEGHVRGGVDPDAHGQPRQQHLVRGHRRAAARPRRSPRWPTPSSTQPAPASASCP